MEDLRFGTTISCRLVTHLHRRERDYVAVSQLCRSGRRNAVYRCPAGRSEIFDHGAVTLAPYRGMRPADARVVENESGISSPADKHIVVADVEHLAPQMFGRQDDEAGRTRDVAYGPDSLPSAGPSQSGKA